MLLKTRTSRPRLRCSHKLSTNLFPLEFKSFRKRPFLSVQTSRPILLSLICLASIVGGEGFGIGPGTGTGSSMLGQGEGVGRLASSHGCGSKRSMMRGDVGAIQQVKEKLDSSESEGRRGKSRRRRFLAFPSNSKLTWLTSLTMPVANYNNGFQILKKYLAYNIIIKLPTEHIVIPGFKKVVVISDYGPPRPDSIVKSRPPATYGSPPAPAPAPSYSVPAPSPAPSYSAPAPTRAPSYSAPAPTRAPSYSAPAPAAANPSSSYSKFQKDLGNGHVKPGMAAQGPEYTFSPVQTEAHHFGVFRDPPRWENFTEVEDPTIFNEVDHHDHPHHSNDPSNAGKQVDVIMSEMDHQRLLGFMTIEKTFDSAGLPGRWCLLRAVCEVAAEPLADMGLVGEMIDLFLAAGYGDGSPALMEYIIAEEIGYTDGACEKHFQACPVDLTELLGESADVFSNTVYLEDNGTQL